MGNSGKPTHHNHMDMPLEGRFFAGVLGGSLRSVPHMRVLLDLTIDHFELLARFEDINIESRPEIP